MKIRKPSSLFLILLAAMLPTCPLAVADTLEIPVGEQTKEKWSINRPVKGMNKQQVEAIFGKPNESTQAVGEPPISSWTYSDFVVYFEWDHVIHTVLKHVAHGKVGQ